MTNFPSSQRLIYYTDDCPQHCYFHLPDLSLGIKTSYSFKWYKNLSCYVLDTFKLPKQPNKTSDCKLIGKNSVIYVLHVTKFPQSQKYTGLQSRLQFLIT